MRYWSFLLLLVCLVSCKTEKKEDEVADHQTMVNFQQLKDAELSSGHLYRVDNFPSKYITPRPVDVWLPENYNEANTYDVLYMHDGQMLFDAKTTWNKQEWKVDEWASKLMGENKTRDFIVVAIHNIPEIRWQDLFPEKAFRYIDEAIRDSIRDLSGKTDYKLNGDNYLKFIVDELKPLIDLTYAVNPGKTHTYIMGSSMGGLMSMYALSEYPDVFGGAACLSTHWVGAMPMDNNPFPDAIFNYMQQHLPKASVHKLYFDYGNKTLDEHYPQYAPKVDEVLQQKGYTEVNSRNLFFENTDHSENSWNQRLDQPLVFLLGK